MIGFAIPVFGNTVETNVILSSLLAQSNPNWRAVLYFDGPFSIDDINKIQITDEERRITKFFNNNRANDWGHTPRNLGKDLLIQQGCTYVVMSGHDNYYTPNTVEEITQASQSSPGLIYWDMVHSHYNYQQFICTPGYNQIDIGAFATRADIASQIQLSSDYAADGLFVEEYKARFNDPMVKIHKILYVHN